MLEPPEVQALLTKIRRNGVPLSEYAGMKPLYGIKTGFNEAFLIDTPTRDRLVAEDSGCAEIIKPYLRGQDIERWYTPWAGLWMIVLKSSADHPWPWADGGASAEALFQSSLPSLWAHMDAYRGSLCTRQDRGRYWWELRACDYYDAFVGSKIVYQEIQFHSRYAIDTSEALSNNKTFLLARPDQWLLAILNSPIAWWHNWRFLPHMKDEALTPKADLMEHFPVVPTSIGVAAVAEQHAERLAASHRAIHEARRGLHHWYRAEHGIEKPSQRLADPLDLSADAFIAEIRKARGARKPLSAAAVKAVRDEWGHTIRPSQALLAESERLERDLSDLVNAAYGLAREDVKLLWETAPPRMPPGKPAWLA